MGPREAQPPAHVTVCTPDPTRAGSEGLPLLLASSVPSSGKIFLALPLRPDVAEASLPLSLVWELTPPVSSPAPELGPSNSVQPGTIPSQGKCSTGVCRMNDAVSQALQASAQGTATSRESLGKGQEETCSSSLWSESCRKPGTRCPGCQSFLSLVQGPTESSRPPLCDGASLAGGSPAHPPDRHVRSADPSGDQTVSEA